MTYKATNWRTIITRNWKRIKKKKDTNN